jgi:hypothetical protein
MKYLKNTNIAFARGIASALTSSRLYDIRKPDGWVGEDSEMRSCYWRVGGNAVIAEECGGQLRALRWNDFLATTKSLRYPAK